MPGADTTKLAIAAGTLAVRLRRGEAVVGQLRAELINTLLAVMADAIGHPTPGRPIQPADLIDLMVSLCRNAGMSGMDMAARFNDAVERRP